jgi:hypothetical protein
MSALHFRFDRHAFFRAAQLPPRHRRHPLLRLLMGLLGLALLAVLVVASVFVGAAMLAIGLAARLVRPRSAAARAAATSRGRVVEGEFSVLDDAR